MMLWSLSLVPLIAGLVLWIVGEALSRSRHALSRRGAGGVALVVLGIELALGIWAAKFAPATSFRWGGGLFLSLGVTPAVGVATLLVSTVALPVIAWAAAHEPIEGLSRLVGQLVAFTGAMQLLVLAADWLTLVFAWELVGALSFALIAHRWRDPTATSAACYAYNVTRLGGLGLWVAAGASLSEVGSLDFAALPRVSATAAGHWIAAGVLVAASAKSAQGPFAPWLFRAMEGPSSASALLHSSTMVAAGAWLLIRLHEPLTGIGWFGPATISIGLVTALAGGVVASLQPHVKRLLAASTSAQYGLMFAAVGAGYAGAALAHLVAHAAFKALLFLAAGTVIAIVSSGHIAAMRLGKQLPVVAGTSAIGALALAAVPPLGAAWSKEQVVAALGARSPWLAALVVLAGALSTWYAMRFQLLAFGRGRTQVRPEKPGTVERAAHGFLAALTLLLGLLWLPFVSASFADMADMELPPVHTGEALLSLATTLVVLGAAWTAHSRGLLAHQLRSGSLQATGADWLGLPRLLTAAFVLPTVTLARGCARFDAKVVDAGIGAAAAAGQALSRLSSRVVEVRLDQLVHGIALGSSWTARASRRTDEGGIDRAVRVLGTGVGAAGRWGRSLQTGALPVYYSLATGGLLLLLIALIAGK